MRMTRKRFDSLVEVGEFDGEILAFSRECVRKVAAGRKLTGLERDGFFVMVPLEGDTPTCIAGLADALSVAKTLRGYQRIVGFILREFRGYQFTEGGERDLGPLFKVAAPFN